MSAATKNAVDQAIAAHVADEGDGHLLTGWVLIAAGMNGDNFERESTNYFYELADKQPFHSSLGLARRLFRWVDSFDDEVDEDDD